MERTPSLLTWTYCLADPLALCVLCDLCGSIAQHARLDRMLEECHLLAEFLRLDGRLSEEPLELAR